MSVGGRRNSQWTATTQLINVQTGKVCMMAARLPLDAAVGPLGIYFQGYPLVCGGLNFNNSESYMDVRCYKYSLGSWQLVSCQLHLSFLNKPTPAFFHLFLSFLY